jgi:CheY-like chemotaxis protein
MAEALSSSGRIAELLLVEDNQADVFLTQEALKAGKIANRMHVAHDGEEALRILLKQPPYGEVPTPDLVLLDLNLPRKDGREVLAEIRRTPSLAHLPVVVMTSSKREVELMNSPKLKATCFVVKPLDFEQLKEVVAAIDSFWFSLVRVPREQEKGPTT